MDAVSDIKERLAIEDIVSEYVQLKRAGRNFKGLSPFGNERTPSFMVSPEKQIWHDFSSGKGGNVFSFVMEMEGLDFKGALELLARKAGVDLSQYKTSFSDDTTALKKRLHEALEYAAKFYQVQLTQNHDALDYVRNKRGFSKETIIAFRLGYSPVNGDALLKYLTKKSFTVDELKRAGLVTERRSGTSDMFRGRIMVPLCDAQGLVVGFTARQLANDDASPKYINTPATLLYDKGRQVYGLHLAKESIRKKGFVVIVEGNLDVIASHQAGVDNVVATAGTAMTVQHLKLLKRFTGDVRLCFDQDSAGQNAAERAIELAAQTEVNLQMVTITSGKDPDELIQKDVDSWRQAIDKPSYVVDWLMQRYATQLDITTAVGKRQYTDVVLRIVRRLKDAVEQDHYIKELAKQIDVSTTALRNKLKQGDANPKRFVKKHKDTTLPKDYAKERIVLAQHLLSLVLRFPQLRPVLAGLPSDIYAEPQASRIAEFLLSNPDFVGESTKLNELKDIADYVKMIILLSEELYQNVELSELQHQIEHLAYRLVSEYVKDKKHLLVAQLNDEDSDDTVLVQLKELDSLKKLYQKEP